MMIEIEKIRKGIARAVHVLTHLLSLNIKGRLKIKTLYKTMILKPEM